ncbi:adenosylcobinamide-phosphate synthase [Pueribacillus theae]|uniref:Cobalamin biosynthesis protein CobD n=1 Tax=Pueribacillus theae TaxID=2171751 RepID=A0A2U1K5I0_9BACI|nr:adenosylcobinamide-phosphate synthase [Pueribacillus theae]
MLLYHLIAISAAYFIDRIIGDPVRLPHPVRMIGSLIAIFERSLNQGKYKKLKGTIVLLLIIAIVFSVTLLITLAAYHFHFILGITIEALLIATTIATKGLADAAKEVYQPLSESNLPEARTKLSWIVGRDTEQLTEPEITRATVETVAENTSDGITSPLFWAFLGGAPLAMVYRAVNTCDSMLGYKNEKYNLFGWASARFDDVVNYIPSRVTSIVMILANKPFVPHTRKDCFRIVFRDARKHASPNSGWVEAAVAALLGVQLGGENSYQGIVSKRAVIGDSHYPLAQDHILHVNSIMHRTVIATLLLFWIGGGCIVIASTWF